MNILKHINNNNSLALRVTGGAIFSLFALCAGVLSSCSSDDSGFTPVTLNPVEVTSTTGTSIPASGGNQSIVINGTIAKAYSSDSWLDVKTSGSTVTVSANAIDSREKRSTSVVIKTSDKDSTAINISQEGLTLAYEGDHVIIHSYKADTTSVAFTCNETERVKIISQPEWANTTVVGNNLDIAVESNMNGNTAGDLRAGYVKFGIGETVDSVKVIQYYWTNLRGNNKWLLLGYPVRFYSDGSYAIDTSTSSYMTANLTFFGTTATFTFPSVKLFTNLPAINMTLKATLDRETMTFSFNNGEFMGNYGDSIYLAETLIASGFKRTWSTAPLATFKLDVDDDGMVYGRLSGEFPVDGGNLDIIGLWLCAFKQKEYSSTYYYGQGSGDVYGLTPCWLIMPKTTASAKAIDIKRLKSRE